MSKVFAFFILLIFIDCNNSNTEKEQQNKIDSLTDIIKQKENSSAKKAQEKKEKEDAFNKEKALADLRNSILSKVTIDGPHYTPLSLGGLKDITFTLFNDYNYELDEIVLKVYYIRANRDEIKNETIILNNITPNSRRKLTAPDYVPAGRYVTVKIQSATSKAIKLCYLDNGNNEGIRDNSLPIDTVKGMTAAENKNQIYDPYKCRN